MSDIQALVDKANVSDNQLEKQLMQNRGADTAKDRAARYKSTLHRAMVLLQDGQSGQPVTN
jgi:hypothetical protein